MARDARDDDIFPLKADGHSHVAAATDPSDEVSNDAIQLLAIANFNGLCRVITALAECGALPPEEIGGIHDAMTTPLDDERMRDDSVVADLRQTLEDVLAQAMRIAREKERE